MFIVNVDDVYVSFTCNNYPHLFLHLHPTLVLLSFFGAKAIGFLSRILLVLLILFCTVLLVGKLSLSKCIGVEGATL